jgi:hypothetical protein
MSKTISDEFEKQIQALLHKGYPEHSGISEEAFLNKVRSLKNLIPEYTLHESIIPESGHIPFVIVISSKLVATEKALTEIEREGNKAVLSLTPAKPEDFVSIKTVNIPETEAYVLIDIDRGKDTLNITPEIALQQIVQQNRSPLTIDEGVAILTQYPDFLQKNNCFSLLASRKGDQRVPAFWISEGRPKLGWCWDRNPHTWLGSASCKTRVY